MIQTNDIRIAHTGPIITPRELKDLYPLTDSGSENVYRYRSVINDILTGKDRRMIGIVGPCSIHDRTAALEYAQMLKDYSKKVEDRLFLVMRVYFEKPRTTIGWRGLITDPHLDGSYDIIEGLKLARKIMTEINDLGLPIGSEVLDPIVPQYIADLISWAAIGARTTESQTHRQLASGLSMPIGFKNGTSGDLKLAVDAMASTCHEHSFIGIDQDGKTCILTTKGNEQVHMIMRGGRSGPNYYEEFVEDAEELFKAAGIEPKIMIDCSHANSSKDPNKQARVLRSVIDQRKRGKTSLFGFMIESNIHEGNQKIGEDPSELAYGVSITDPCVSWDMTKSMLDSAYQELS